MLLSEKTRDLLTELNKHLPDWADFKVREFPNRIYQAEIIIESDYFKTFHITTESTSIDGALIQIIQMLKTYWTYKEDESEEINELIKELETEKII